MSNNKKILTGIVTIGAIGIAIYLSKRSEARRHQQVLSVVADEGYETAYDILFPVKKQRLRRY
ncbi:MAG: hypothetical protein JWQ96_3230 [Segetibacter sp.]|nr:hypothetical protein [Segetibacter sp.]